MTAPMGWYPDPGGKPFRRYYDGDQWTNDYAPVETTNPSHPRSTAKLLRPFVAVTLASLVIAAVTFALMQFAFESPALWSDLSAMALVAACLVSLMTAGVGIIGATVRFIRIRRH